ncbi:putative transcriptional regulator [Rhizobium aquaticum]|uniref:Transcriptional regulator n=1 Tax=Rhizobium aquaticum TaxID=1549636 RepID=A0ABV2IVQ5_9HYPH
MQYLMDVFSDTSTLTTDVEAFDLVGYNDAKVTADDAPVKGVAKNPGKAGDDIGVVLIGAARVRAKGAIAKGDKLVSAATGGVKTAGATPANAFARALTDAADGAFVKIFIR